MSAGLYVHVPFCRSKCGYCDFYSETDGDPDAVLRAILAEAAGAAGAFGRFDTVYLGGGTPSLLTAGQVDALLRGLREPGEIADGAEVTLEANPDDVTADRAEAWRASGVTRLSLGVQSLDDEELQVLGRRHDAAAARRAVERARAAGFDELGLDLIWGLPSQTPAEWLRTLRRAIDLGPEHLSCYQLTLDEATPMGFLAAEGALELPGDDDAYEMFVTTSRVLGAAGYEHYEISNFARGATHRSRHNQIYWRRQPYLGLGPAAHSFDGRRRWWNVPSITSYLEQVAGGGEAVAGVEEPDDDQARLERLMLGLRTSDGVAVEHLRSIDGWRTRLDALVDEGLLRRDGDRIRPTLAGFALADRLPLRLLD